MKGNDPSLNQGYAEVLQREVLMLIASEEMNLEDNIMVRVFKKGTMFKVEMTSEVNVSFFYLL
jgi:hypothetical protein